MFLKRGDMGSVIEDQPKAKTTRTNNKADIQKLRDKRKDLWDRRICSVKSRVSYWQEVSHCTIL